MSDDTMGTTARAGAHSLARAVVRHGVTLVAMCACGASKRVEVAAGSGRDDALAAAEAALAPHIERATAQDAAEAAQKAAREAVETARGVVAHDAAVDLLAELVHSSLRKHGDTDEAVELWQAIADRRAAWGEAVDMAVYHLEGGGYVLARHAKMPPALGPCGECGGTELGWDLTMISASNAAPGNGQPLASDVRPALVLGCHTCSATVRVATSAAEAGLVE